MLHRTLLSVMITNVETLYVINRFIHVPSTVYWVNIDSILKHFKLTRYRCGIFACKKFLYAEMKYFRRNTEWCNVIEGLEYLPTILNNDVTITKTNIIQGGDDLWWNIFQGRLRPEKKRIMSNMMGNYICKGLTPFI